MIDFHAIAKALADPQRFEILEMVAAEVEMSCGDIAAGCPVSQATVSHHLKVLQDVGLLRVRRQGQRRNISADHEVLSPTCASCRAAPASAHALPRSPLPSSTSFAALAADAAIQEAATLVQAEYQLRRCKSALDFQLRRSDCDRGATPSRKRTCATRGYSRIQDAPALAAVAAATKHYLGCAMRSYVSRRVGLAIWSASQA